jgi:hypothetical protein
MKISSFHAIRFKPSELIKFSCENIGQVGQCVALEVRAGR